MLKAAFRAVSIYHRRTLPRDREDGASVATKVAQLRRLAQPCQFSAEVLEEMLCDRLVYGIRNPRLQSRPLSEPNLTLITYVALTIAQAYETAAANTSELSRGVPGTPDRVEFQPVNQVVEQRQRLRHGGGSLGERDGGRSCSMLPLSEYGA